MTNRKLDPLMERLFAPLCAPLSRAGATPNQITLLGVLLSFAGAAVLASGRLRTGIGILIFTWLFDVLDGVFAKYSGQRTRFGGFLDSVMDRYTEGAVFMAFAYHYASTGNALMTAATVFALIGAAAVSYARSRAENEINGKCDVGVGARMPRLVAIAVATLAGFPGVGIITVMILSHYTVLQRIVYTRHVIEAREEQALGGQQNEKEQDSGGQREAGCANTRGMRGHLHHADRRDRSREGGERPADRLADADGQNTPGQAYGKEEPADQGLRTAG